MIRIGVIGAGAHSRLHGQALRHIRAEAPGEVCLAAVCDIDETRRREYADEFGFETGYPAIESMLDHESLDVLLAITPIDLTAELVPPLLTRASRDGFVLLVEKPPGVNARVTRDLAELAMQSGCKHMVSFNRRFSPALRYAMEQIDSKGMPVPFHVSGSMVRLRRREAGFAVGTGIHIIDTMCAVMGNPVSVTCEHHGLAHTRGFTAHIQFDHGRSGSLVIAPDSGYLAEELRFFGDGYTANVDMFNCACEVISADESGRTVTDRWNADDSADERFRDGTIDEMRMLLKLVHADQPKGPAKAIALPTLESSRRSMVLAQAIADDYTGDLG